MRRFLVLVIVITITLSFVAVERAQAGQGSISIAQIGCWWGVDTLKTGGRPRFVLKFDNNTGEKVDISNGFRISSPDGAVWDSVTIDTVGYDFGGHSTLADLFDRAFALMRCNFCEYNPDTVGILGSGTQVNPLRQLPVGFSDTALAITVYCPSSGTVNNLKHHCIDSSFFQPGGTWSWVGQSLTVYRPTFQAPAGIPYSNADGGYCFLLYNPPCLNASGATQASANPENINCVSCLKCCRGYTGNVNMSEIVDLGDLSSLVSYLTGGGYNLPCVAEANINATGIVDLADLSALVSYLTGGGFALPVCGS